MNTLQDILRRLQSLNPGFKQRMQEAEAVGVWEKVVGPQIAKHAIAKKIENGILYVEVDHSIWKTEIHHRKAQIQDKLNAATGNRGVVKEIFLVDPVVFRRR